jgi:pimeloyl-ACP methyl ester carboxylesterase
VPHFDPHFTVYAMDRRGRGGSGDAADYNILREAEDVAAVVDGIGDAVSILGHSYGAVCSLEAALLTNKIDKLVLYEPPIPTGIPFTTAGVPERMQALIDQDEREAALEVFMREVVRMPEQELATYRRLPMWEGRIQLAPTIPRELALEQTYSFDAERFDSLQVPTLLLSGSDSPRFFKEATETVHRSLPNSRSIILPDQQHIAMDTNTDLFAKEVLNFLLA